MLKSRTMMIPSALRCCTVLSLLLLLLLLLLLPPALHASSADNNHSWFQRKVVGVKQGFTWMLAPLTTSSKRRPKKVTIARVGFGRTGTTSLETALKKLGYVPMQDDNLWEVSDLFRGYYNGSLTMDEWAVNVGRRGFDASFNHDDAFLEWASKNQEVNVILGVRDTANIWAQSWVDTGLASYWRLWDSVDKWYEISNPCSMQPKSFTATIIQTRIRIFLP